MCLGIFLIKTDIHSHIWDAYKNKTDFKLQCATPPAESVQNTPLKYRQRDDSLGLTKSNSLSSPGQCRRIQHDFTDTHSDL